MQGCVVTNTTEYPVVEPTAAYDQLYPYYVSACAVSQIKGKFSEGESEATLGSALMGHGGFDCMGRHLYAAVGVPSRLFLRTFPLSGYGLAGSPQWEPCWVPSISIFAG
jgi:hypothetical protein